MDNIGFPHCGGCGRVLPRHRKAKRRYCSRMCLGAAGAARREVKKEQKGYGYAWRTMATFAVDREQ